MSRIFVILVTLILLGSIAFVIHPDFFSVNGLKLEGAAATTDVRVNYGTFPLALGLFLLPGALRKTGHEMELRLITFVFAGVVAGRLIGLLVDKGDQSYTLGAVALEAVLLIIAVVLLRREKRRATA